MEGAFSNSHSLEVFPKWVLDTLASLELVPVTHVNHVTHVTHVTHDSICSSSVSELVVIAFVLLIVGQSLSI